MKIAGDTPVVYAVASVSEYNNIQIVSNYYGHKASADGALNQFRDNYPDDHFEIVCARGWYWLPPLTEGM